MKTSRTQRQTFWGSWSRAFVAGLILLSSMATIAQDTPARREIYCGPRAVQRVLKFYGKPADLVDLIREMEWKKEDEGTSFEELSQSLQRRGLVCRSVRVPDLRGLAWDAPAIAQIDIKGRKHFVVWLPPAAPGERPRIWDGAQSAPVLAGRIIGLDSCPVLLTSLQAIPDTAPLGQETFSALSTGGIVGIGCLAFLIGFLLPFRRPGVSRS